MSTIPPTAPPAAPRRTASRAERWVTLAFLLSGAAGLILEVVWTRLLHLAFGANAPAVSTVLAVYMGGMALGAFAVSRWPQLRRRPLLGYALLEYGIAAVALLLPWAIGAVAPLHRWVTAQLDPQGSFLLVLALRALLLGSLLLLPTAAMGATLPLLAEGARRQVAVRRIGVLYAVNLLGAVLGSALVGFVLIPALGLSASNKVAVLLDLLAASLALWVSRGQGATAPAGEEGPAQRWRRSGAVTLALVAIGLTGALAMQLQVLWSRALSVVIGSSTYAFSLILVVTLAGMALGGRLVASRAQVGGVREALRRLGLLFAVAAAGVLGGALLIDRLPLVIRDAARMPHLSVPALFTVELAVIAAVVLVPATALGGALPAVLQVARRQVEQAAGSFVGRAYAINTVGAIVGSLLGGFVIVPALGVDRGLQLTALSYGLLGALLVIAAIPARRGLRQRLSTAALAAVLAVAVALTPGFDVMRWSAGFFRVYLPRANQNSRYLDDRLLYHRDGIIATVTVEDNGGSIALKVNGKVDASSYGDMPTQILSGLLPLVFHDGPRHGAVIGFGSGVTVGSLLLSDIAQLDVVELETHVLEAGQLFAHVNGSPWENPRVQLVIDDGRNYLERGGAPFDLIVSEPSNPWMTGAASLFTEEFWQIARSRLADDGVFLQWVQLYELGDQRIRSLVGTFASVFEHVLMFSANPGSSDTFLIGARRPLTIDMNRVHRLFADPAIRAALAQGELEEPAELLGLLLLGDEEVRSFAAGAPRNTDDNAYVEFHAPLDLIAYAVRDPDLSGLRQVLGRRPEQVDKLVVGEVVPGADACHTALALAAAMVRQGCLEDALRFVDRVDAGCRDQPAHAAAARRQREIIEVLDGPAQETVVDPTLVEEGDLRYLRVVAHMIDGHEDVALADLEAVAESDTAPPGWLLLWAYLANSTSRYDDAEFLFDKLLEDRAFLARMPETYYYAARNAFDRGHHRDAERWARFFVEARAVRDGG